MRECSARSASESGALLLGPWRRAAELREATGGRKVTPSEELIREDRDLDHREDNR
jgi:hypothetical protein